MHSVTKICLSCKYFRLEDVEQGVCRIDKDSGRAYPKKSKDAVCAQWHNCGQQYYIRLGWIRGKSGDSAERAGGSGIIV